jgi:hypothetical protein
VPGSAPSGPPELGRAEVGQAVHGPGKVSGLVRLTEVTCGPRVSPNFLVTSARAAALVSRSALRPCPRGRAGSRQGIPATGPLKVPTFCMNPPIRRATTGPGSLPRHAGGIGLHSRLPGGAVAGHRRNRSWSISRCGLITVHGVRQWPAFGESPPAPILGAPVKSTDWAPPPTSVPGVPSQTAIQSFPVNSLSWASPHPGFWSVPRTATQLKGRPLPFELGSGP